MVRQDTFTLAPYACDPMGPNHYRKAPATARAARARRRLATALAVAAGFAAQSASAATDTADTRITVVTPLSLIKIDDLVFGSMLAGPTPGTVTIAINTGNRTSTGGVTPVGAGYHRAEFAGMAAVGLFTTVNVPANTTLNRIGGGASMNAALVREGPALRLFPGAGIQFFRVGGTLTVGANQMPGSYRGTFVLTVNYF
jgi:spore coat protein U-like protein